MSLSRLELGTPVACSDGPFGSLGDVVIDPVKKRVTHLVVEPSGELGLARLVPIDLADGGDKDGIALRCTSEAVAKFPTVHEAAYIRTTDFPVGDPDWDVGVQDVLAMPYYSSGDFGVYTGLDESPIEVAYDRVPKGEVEIRRKSVVLSADDHHLGEVEAFLCEGDEITHLVLEGGHLWGKRDVTIPIGAVQSVETDSVTLKLSKDEVGKLPAARVHRWWN
jgi:sporulation protein YlmC with PRC-barrel domain